MILSLATPLLVFPVLSYIIPQEVFIGGIFDLFAYDLNGSFVPQESGLQQFVAFKMAIDEINNRTDRFVGPRLRFVTSQGPDSPSIWENTYYDGAKAALDILSSAPAPVLAVVSSASHKCSTTSSIKMLSDWKVPQILAASFSRGQDDALLQAMSLQLAPAETYQGSVLHDILEWTEVGIFYTTDTYGFVTLESFHEANEDKRINVLCELGLSVDSTDYTSAIAEAKRAGPTVFLLFLDAEFAGPLLEQGYSQGLFQENTQVFGTSRASSRAVWQAMSPTANVAAIMKGYIALEPAPSMYLKTSTGQRFLQQYTATFTDVVRKSGKTFCNNETDDGLVTPTRRHNYLYQFPSNPGNFGSFRCVANNTSTEATLDPVALYVYDAVNLIVWGIDQLIRRQLQVTGRNLYDFFMCHEQTYHDFALTGDICFAQGTAKYQFYGRGERVSGGIYLLNNFQKKVFDSSFGEAGFATVGYYDAGRKNVVYCFDSDGLARPAKDLLENCQRTVYRTSGSGYAPPTGKPADVILETSPQLVLIARVLFGLTIVLQIISLGIIVVNWNEREVKNAQPIGLLVSLLGCLCWGAYVALRAETTPTTCQLSYLFRHLTVISCFLPTQLKFWRIHKLVNAPPMSRMQISETRSRVVLISTLLVAYIIILLSYFFKNAEIGYYVAVKNNQRFLTPYCKPPRSLISSLLTYLLDAYELIVFFSCGLFMWLTRSAPKHINETEEFRLPSIIGSALVLVGVLFLAIWRNETDRLLVMFCFATAGLTGYNFGYILLKRRRILRRKIAAHQMMSTMDTEETNSWDPLRLSSRQAADSLSCSEENVSYVNELLKSRPTLNQMNVLCEEQIHLWTAVGYQCKELEDNNWGEECLVTIQSMNCPRQQQSPMEVSWRQSSRSVSYRSITRIAPIPE